MREILPAITERSDTGNGYVGSRDDVITRSRWREEGKFWRERSQRKVHADENNVRRVPTGLASVSTPSQSKVVDFRGKCPNTLEREVKSVRVIKEHGIGM